MPKPVKIEPVLCLEFVPSDRALITIGSIHNQAFIWILQEDQQKYAPAVRARL